MTTTTTLITGATRGIGLEAARRLSEAGHRVLLGARDLSRGREAAHRVGAHPLMLDVTDDASVEAAAQRVADEVGRLDVLVNNAGITGALHTCADEITAADLLACYDTNVFGAVRMMHAFTPLLRKSARPVVVNVSSGLGSLAAATDPGARAEFTPTWIPVPVYASSKAALNMVTVQYAHAHPEMRINAVDPGHTATDFNGHAGPQTVEEGAEIVVRMADAGSDAPTAGYFAAAGPVPW
ncbi:SDR family NAD(P)-dependent oxidoreductase [Streptomonospora salina]|uniref:NAD(P)-dependent dehydrogenase (Short-subunit alcohol dehydrogenase family) n=1 Tax=Streptomonospora salina TaxID=104205 RepID=A0A841EIR5_9ACTN|nr:SDR family NAD(P)-dependent oxidoreductase [Streptomonospora salina]MBB6000933.1 NAD(P)-dependent dehydrogenase (short-subunit alcohol dehydrogenase family) [Streptomonospora salina]